MAIVQIIPAVLVASGHFEQAMYERPFVKIRRARGRRLSQAVGRYTRVSITVPIFYDESSQLEDAPHFRLKVFDKKTKNKVGVAEYKGKDTFAHFDQYRKSLRVRLPPPPRADSAASSPVYTRTYDCHFEVALELKSRASDWHRTISAKDRTSVKVCWQPHAGPESHEMVYVGINVGTDFEPDLTEEEWREQAELQQWKDHVYKQYRIDKYSHLEVDEEDGF